MIYMDPPYGIKFASNFQPEVGKRDVKDKQEDLTRERERQVARQSIRVRKGDEAFTDWVRQLRDRAFVEYRLDDS
jgi:hypothetical protein